MKDHLEWLGDNLGWVPDNADWLLGATFGLISIVVAVLIYFGQRKPKTLDYEVLHTLAVLTPHASSLRDNLKIFYDTDPVKNPYLIGVRVKNTGKVPVVAKEYINPIKLHVSNGIPLDCLMVDGSHQGLAGGTLTDLDNAHFELRPELLNENEWFDLQLLADSEESPTISVSSRFYGQTRDMNDLKEIRKKRTRWFKSPSTLYTLAVIVSAFTLTDQVEALITVLIPLGIVTWSISWVGRRYFDIQDDGANE